MRLLTTFTLLTICLASIGQTFPTKKDSRYRVDTLFTKKDKMQVFYPAEYVDTESRYTDSTGKGIIIQNSLPKGGGAYKDAAGENFSYVIFWTRVFNETDTPVELTINFPTDSFPVIASGDAYLKVFLPSDTMTLDKVFLYDYGLTGLISFLDTAFHKPTMLQRTINGNEECLFYIGMLFYQARGTIRTRLVLEGHELFYRINLLDSELIPCGQIVFKN